jgi:tetratricopeptide (TPR) repeat protein
MARNEAYLEAEQKIEIARRTGARELTLESKYYLPDCEKLTELPEALCQLAQLEELHVSSNQLTALPDSLGQLTQLQALDVSSNQLTALPDWLGQLTQLQTLYVPRNQLTALPDSLGQLTQLQTLDVSSNQLTALPDSLGQLTQLQTLYVPDNQLTALPESLGGLTMLRFLRLRGNPPTALPESLGRPPQGVAILEELALLRYDQKRYDQAVKVLDHVLAVDPKNAFALRIRALSFRASRRFKEAQQAIDKALGRFPNDPEILNERALLHYDQKEYEEAIKVFERVLKLKPYNTEALLWRSSSWRKLGRYDKAARSISGALEKDRPADLLEEKGWIAFDQDRFEEALKSFDEALKSSDEALKSNVALDIESDLINASLAKVQALTRLNRDGQARDVLKRLQKKFPHNSAIAEEVGFFYLSRNDPVAAQKEFQALLDKDPEDLVGLNGMGSVRSSEGRYDQAVEYYEKAAQLYPYVAAVQAGLSLTLVK